MQFAKFDPERDDFSLQNTFNDIFEKQKIKLEIMKSKLGNDQLNVYNIIIAYCHKLPFVKTLDNPLGQLRMFLTGAAGTGKSKLIEILKFYYMMYFGHDFTVHGPVLLAAFTGIAAIAIDGVTIDSAFYTYLLKGGKLDSKTIFKIQQELGKVKLIIIDEISMVGLQKFGQLDEICKIATGKFHLPMGGIDFVVVGDFHQLPPVKKQGVV